jgi:acetoin utilization deacetylase AcuC-like enzyme
LPALSTRRPHLVWDASYEIDLGPHVFITAKYRLTRERLLDAGTAQVEQFLPPVVATPSELARVHTASYLAKIAADSFSLSERMNLEIPFTSEVRDAMLLSTGGTLLACRLALEEGAAGHLGGGFHHAYADHGEGFCLLNDVAVAARCLCQEGVIGRSAVVDLDVHHGNGTASIFADDPAVFTFSMHQDNNYPAYKPPSDLDIGLEDGVGDDEYLSVLAEALPGVLRERPELIIYLAGADPYRDDQLGGLRLTRDGLRERDRLVFEAANRNGIPLAVVLAGGYAYRLEDTVAIHTATIEELGASTGM